MSIGVNTLLTLNIGMGPVDTFTLLLQNFANLSEFGNASLMFHLLFAVLLVVMSKYFKLKLVDIGISVISIFFITRVVNLFGFIKVGDLGLGLFIICFLAGFLILNLGLYFIAKSNIIIAPYDKFVKELANALNLKIGTNRVICDSVLFVVIVICKVAFSVAVVISWGTIIVTFFTGLNIRLYEKVLDQHVNKIIE